MFNSINTNGNDGYDSIIFGDNGKGKVKGLGKIVISNDMSIFNVLLVESLNFNLLSVAQLCDLGFKCIFGVDDVEIISVDGSNLIFKGFSYENLYPGHANQWRQADCCCQSVSFDNKGADDELLMKRTLKAKRSQPYPLRQWGHHELYPPNDEGTDAMMQIC